MGRIIVIQFITLDGVVEDPDGSDGTSFGGWAMRHGPAAIAGDKFRLGPILEHGTLLFGRRTWEHFATLWPFRDDEFSRAMNSATKSLVTRRSLDVAAWSNSTVVDGPLLDWTRDRAAATDVVVIGSGSLVNQLVEADLVDEYRLRTFPTVAGSGRRLFTTPGRYEFVGVEPMGPTTLSILRTERSDPAGGGR